MSPTTGAILDWPEVTGTSANSLRILRRGVSTVAEGAAVVQDRGLRHEYSAKKKAGIMLSVPDKRQLLPARHLRTRRRRLLNSTRKSNTVSTSPIQTRCNSFPRTGLLCVFGARSLTPSPMDGPRKLVVSSTFLCGSCSDNSASREREGPALLTPRRRRLRRRRRGGAASWTSQSSSDDEKRPQRSAAAEA